VGCLLVPHLVKRWWSDGIEDQENASNRYRRVSGPDSRRKVQFTIVSKIMKRVEDGVSGLGEKKEKKSKATRRRGKGGS